MSVTKISVAPSSGSPAPAVDPVEKLAEAEVSSPMECCGAGSKYGRYGPMCATLSLASSGAYIFGIIFQRIFFFNYSETVTGRIGLFLSCVESDGSESCSTVDLTCSVKGGTLSPCDLFNGMRFMILVATLISITASFFQVCRFCE